MGPVDVAAAPVDVVIAIETWSRPDPWLGTCGKFWFVTKSASWMSERVKVEYPGAAVGMVPGSVKDFETVVFCQAPMAGTGIEPMVTSLMPPTANPVGVRTTRARVAGASPAALLVICAFTVTV